MGNWVKSNHNHADAYIGSGYAFAKQIATVSTTVIEVKFPGLSRWVYIRNNGAQPLKVGFSTAGIADDQYIYLKAGEHTPRLELKTGAVYLLRAGGTNTTDVSVVAGLTDIPLINFPQSGSLGGLR